VGQAPPYEILDSPEEIGMMPPEILSIYIEKVAYVKIAYFSVYCGFFSDKYLLDISIANFLNCLIVKIISKSLPLADSFHNFT
jgi:hypothetical protein